MATNNPMKYLVILFCFISLTAFSQSDFESHLKCKKTGKMTAQQRFNQFPFAKAAEIKVIAFNQKISGPVGHELEIHIDSIVLNKSIFNPDRYTEVATLNRNQIDKLTDIIFNFSNSTKTNVSKASGCYEPRNAIFFLDPNNIIIAYIEICFECDGYRTSNLKKLNLGDMCTEKFEMIKNVFRESKIKYGVEIE